ADRCAPTPSVGSRAAAHAGAAARTRLRGLRGRLPERLPVSRPRGRKTLRPGRSPADQQAGTEPPTRPTREARLPRTPARPRRPPLETHRPNRARQLGDPRDPRGRRRDRVLLGAPTRHQTLRPTPPAPARRQPADLAPKRPHRRRPRTTRASSGCTRISLRASVASP